MAHCHVILLENYKNKNKSKKNVLFNHGSITFVERLFNSLTLGGMLIIRKAIFIRKLDFFVILLEQKIKQKQD
jgi:hypothetical protein